MQQIATRRVKITGEVQSTDHLHGFNELDFGSSTQTAFSMANAALLKKFQQGTSNSFEEDLAPNFNFHATLKQRLNFVDSRAQ